MKKLLLSCLVGLTLTACLAQDANASVFASVDVSSVIPGTGATNSGKAEDAAAGSGDTGPAILGQRNDGNDTALTSATGDYGHVSLNQFGNVKIQVEGSAKSSFACSTGAFTAAASATDISTLVFASSGKVIKLKKCVVSYLNAGGAAGGAIVNLIKRTTADTTGTSSSPTIVQKDTNGASVTGVVKLYTANPGGLGTSAGIVSSQMYGTSSNATNMVLYDSSVSSAADMTLRATDHGFCVNLDGVSPLGTTPKFSVTWEWTEEP